MCQAHYTIYDFCRCEEPVGNSLCAGGHDGTGCPGVNIETVRMFCYCRTHASKSWTSMSQAARKHKKLQRRQKTPVSEKPFVPKRWFSWSSLRSRNSFS